MVLVKVGFRATDLSFYDRFDQKPSFKGKEGEAGWEAFKQWVQAHVKPQGSHGTVLVRFVVGRNGGVQEVQIQRGVSPALDNEALRVVRSAPKWSMHVLLRMLTTLPCIRKSGTSEWAFRLTK